MARKPQDNPQLNNNQTIATEPTENVTAAQLDALIAKDWLQAIRASSNDLTITATQGTDYYETDNNGITVSVARLTAPMANGVWRTLPVSDGTEDASGDSWIVIALS